ncbi:MAG: hypothetical protein IKB38_10550 [Clostridia bacterium]|nr:hypothetical protein [Clostridia bacterium]
MQNTPKERHIAYRCPECGAATVGLIGKFTQSANMIRLKCTCEKSSALDLNLTGDGKVKLSVPCLLCKQNHTYTVSEGILLERDSFSLSCPYSGFDIAFVSDSETVSAELERTERELDVMIKGFEAESLEDLQPKDMTEEEILPDPAVYDTIRFVVKDLEAEGKVSCPCGKGEGYELRFADGGIDVYCPECGASKLLEARSAGISEEYLELDSLELK